MIVTDDDRLADLCRSMRNQGRDTSAWLSHARLGYNYRLDEMSAALGEVQMGRLDDLLAKRRRAAEMYRQALGGIQEVRLPPMTEPDTASWFVYVVRLADRFTQKHRDAVMAHLARRGIGTNNYFSPVHLQGFYRKQFGYKPGDFPVTERIAARTLALPFHNRLGAKDQDLVIETLKSAIVRL